MIVIKQKGSFKKTDDFLNRSYKLDYDNILDKYGKEGVLALQESTPKDTGLTSLSWSYKIEKTKNKINIVWSNSNIAGETPVAILLQYGHATGNGAFIQGYDYINPTLKPIFKRIADDIWKEITKRWVMILTKE